MHLIDLFRASPPLCAPATVLAVLRVPTQDRYLERALTTTHKYDDFISGRQHCVMHTGDVEEHKTPEMLKC